MSTAVHEVTGLGPDDAEFWDANIAKAKALELRQRPRAKKDGPRVGLEFPDDILVETACRDVVKNILPAGGLCVLYGPSRVGKSFLVIKLAFAIGRGESFAGRKVRKAPVLYVGLEGGAKLRNRFAAASNKYGSAGANVARMTVPAVLKRGAGGEGGLETVVANAHALAEKAGAAVGLIVIDTLARAMAGDDENSSEDMAAFIEERAAKITSQTGAAVLVVHHTGKDATRGMRGSYALLAAADAVIEVTDAKAARLEKVKDGPDGEWFSYSLDRVELGTDDDGDPITSCTVTIADAPTTPTTADRAKNAEAKLNAPAKKALDMLRRLYNDGAALNVEPAAIDLDGVPPDQMPRVVTRDAWRSKCREARLSESSAKAAEPMAFKRACESLEKAGITCTYGDYAWLVGQRRNATGGPA